MRPLGALPEDPVAHASLLVFASDHGLMSTARYAHGIGRGAPSSASLDHAVWFHRPPRFDGWVLFTSESPVAHAARALIIGRMHGRDGTHLATVVQEGLIRQERPPA
jgi:acyl-CoA thioesterase-2